MPDPIATIPKPLISGYVLDISVAPSTRDELTKLKNIGPKSAVRLREAGIESREHIADLGAVEVYRRVRQHYPASLTMLWALPGALFGLPYYQIPPEIREALLDELARLERQLPNTQMKCTSHPYYNLVK